MNYTQFSLFDIDAILPPSVIASAPATPVPAVPPPAVEVDRVVDSPALDEPLALRDYQVRVVSHVMQGWDKGARRILIISPTGSGKTIMGLAAAERLRERIAADRGVAPEKVRVGWMTMRRSVMEQAYKAQQSHFPHLPIVLLSPFQSASLKERVDILVSDEAHHDGSQVSVDLQYAVQPTVTIGLSATPVRTDRVRLGYQFTVRESNYDRLISQGYLAPYALWNLPIWTPESVTECFLSAPERWGQSFMFFRTLNECSVAERILSRHGIACAVASGSTDVDDQLSEFSAGRLQVLLSVLVLTEGVDVPSLKSVFVRDGSRGPTIQMVGRALRIDPSKDHANVVQSLQTSYPFSRTALPEATFTMTDGAWQETSGPLLARLVVAEMVRLMMLSPDTEGLVGAA